ncbi:MAG TPA: hydroxyacid-oxoacid transhydrogenase [Polyangiaceae bacterium]|nr:hydroxyacid-oxoacid transhydrogenase [Polyangiaceae bacterium]
MSCCHYPLVEGNEAAFTVDLSAITFGPGVLGEAGDHLKAHGCRRVALYTDRTLAALEPVDAVTRSLRAAGIDVALYVQTHVEPTDASFRAGAAFASDGKFDGYVSVGGGSVIDTCKASLLYATYPAPFAAYVNAPVGDGKPVPGPLPPHVACPTTCGTGSECTGIAVFDDLTLRVKTGIASRRLRPTAALIDPTCTRTLPSTVVAASGFDVLCHALESYTARAYTARLRPDKPASRPMSQGRNPWSDVGSAEALRLGGRFFLRAVRDAADHEAREGLSWAATLAGIAFGNAGVHLPHAMSYAVAGMVRDYKCPGYPQEEPLVPHGVSVIVNAPSVFRATASTLPERHLAAAAALGADTRGAAAADAGEILSGLIVRLMRDAHVPNGVGGVGYGEGDLGGLAKGAVVQKRLVDNAPLAVDETAMRALFRGALSYW